MSKVIIFDMDGVLIDSEPAYLEMNKKLFAQFGIEMDDENYNALVGMPSLPVWTMLKEKYDLKNEVSDFMHLEKQRMNEIIDSKLITKPINGIESLLDRLKEKNYILSVASSSAKANINFVLEKLNLKKYFDFVISGEEVLNGKPAPDIFLKVAERFNIKSENCIVIEDSTNGVKAAVSAGMKSVGFKNNNSNLQDLTEADIIVQSFVGENLKKILELIDKELKKTILNLAEEKKYRSKNNYIITIRNARTEDVMKIIEIKKAVVTENIYMMREIEETNYTKEGEKKDIENHLNNSGSLYIVAEAENEVIGFLEFENGGLKRTAHSGMLSMFILKEWRECGIGKMLMESMINWAEENPIIEKVTLAVFSSNSRAQNLYKKFGFIEEGRCPKDMKLKDGTYIDSVLMYKFVK